MVLRTRTKNIHPAAVFVIVFVVIGTIMLFVTLAGQFSQGFEAEQNAPNQIVRTDSAASGNQFVEFGSSGGVPSGNSGIARCEELYGRYGTQRDFVRCPFSEDSPINTPIPTVAVFTDNDPRTSQLRNATHFNYNNSVWSVAVYDAAEASAFNFTTANYCPRWDHPCNAEVPSNMVASQDSDGHAGFFGPNAEFYHEFYQYNQFSNTASIYVRRSLTESGIPRSNTYDGTRAWGGSNLGGLIRTHEIEGGEITHPIAIGIHEGQLKKGWVFPAGSEDSFSDRYAGSVPMGTRFGIPPNVDVESLPMSEGGKMFARALQTYGGYVFDQAGPANNITFFAEIGSPYPAGFDPWVDMQQIANVITVVDWCTPQICSW